MTISDKLLSFFRSGNSTGFFKNYLLGQQGAIWIDTHEPRKLYDTIPQLKTVVDKDCSMFSNAELWHVNKEGERLKDSEVEQLLMKPNVTQTMQEFLFQYKQQFNLYGNQFIFKNKPSTLSKLPASLMNVSAFGMKPQLTGKLFRQVELSGIISHYEYDLNSLRERFEVDEIMWTKRTDPDNPIVGCSIIEALKYPLSNTKAAYEYRNVIMTKKGAIGILSNESKDSMGAATIKKEDKEKLEKQYSRDYGIEEHQSQVILTEAQLKWQPMTYPTKDLLLFEEVEANMITIADAFGHNINIYTSKNATFENVKNSIIQTYQDAIFPAADLFTQGLTSFLELPNGERIIASYEYLQIMKENKLSGMAAIQQIITALSQGVTAGLIKPEVAMLTLENELGIV